MNIKLITLSRLREFFSNLNSKLTGFTTSGRNYKLSQDSNGNYYTNVPWKGVVSGNDGISVTEEASDYSVSAVPRTKSDIPTCPGYTLYGEYFLSDNPYLNDTAIDYNNQGVPGEGIVTVTQNYNYGSAETKEVTPRLLTRNEIDTLANNERACGVPYYSADATYDFNAYYITADGEWATAPVGNSYTWIYIRYGFRNPFLDIEDLAVSKRQIFTLINMYSKNQFSFDSSKKILNISL